jgi:hypothetical protein
MDIKLLTVFSSGWSLDSAFIGAALLWLRKALCPFDLARSLESEKNF